MGLDVNHFTGIPQRGGGEKFFSLTSSFIRTSQIGVKYRCGLQLTQSLKMDS